MEENDHAAKTKTKLSSVKTNKEYSAILVEVDAVKEKILALEDRELELMEILERKERELLPLKANCKEEEEKFNEYKLKKEAESERTEKELEVIRPRRSQAADNLDVKLLEHYTKVFNARQGVVVVPIHENICQGCLQQILPQQVIDVKSGETITLLRTMFTYSLLGRSKRRRGSEVNWVIAVSALELRERKVRAPKSRILRNAE